MARALAVPAVVMQVGGRARTDTSANRSAWLRPIRWRLCRRADRAVTGSGPVNLHSTAPPDRSLPSGSSPTSTCPAALRENSGRKEPTRESRPQPLPAARHRHAGRPTRRRARISVKLSGQVITCSIRSGKAGLKLVYLFAQLGSLPSIITDFPGVNFGRRALSNPPTCTACICSYAAQCNSPSSYARPMNS
jgi:hypothetical protein